MRGAVISGIASSTLSLVLAAVATTTLLARAMAPVAREARNCLLLWLALHGTRPDQRSQVIKALPPLDQRPLPPPFRSRGAKPSGTLTATHTNSPFTTDPQNYPAAAARGCGHVSNVPTCSKLHENDISPG